jgi:hypothetical protein
LLYEISKKQKVQLSNQFKTDFNTSNLENAQKTVRPANIKNLKSQTFKSNRFQEYAGALHTKSTKNIVKNYARAIVNFNISEMSKPYLSQIIEDEKLCVTEQNFFSFIRSY